MTLAHELCLPGYAINGQSCECIEQTHTVLFCLPDQKGVLLAVSSLVNIQYSYICVLLSTCFHFHQDGLWGAPPTWSRTLVTYTCPSGYCNCTGDIESQETEGCPLLYDTPFKICDDTREGNFRTVHAADLHCQLSELLSYTAVSDSHPE